ncbi:hypothetical protein SAMN04487983_1001279 [Streptomyces sp. yr375]|nr:hypothetical protein SAMN04487983_1001279 [Streptomyces sp. yr375]
MGGLESARIRVSRPASGVRRPASGMRRTHDPRAAALELTSEMVQPGLNLEDIPAIRQGPGIALLAQLDLTAVRVIA